MTLFSTDSQRFKDLTANYDSRKFPLCAPHDGTKGLAFQRFANDFLIAIAAIDLKDPNETYDLSETLVGIDEGGSVAPPGQAAPIPMGTSQTAARRRTKRLKLAFAHLYQHITDLTLRKMLVDEAHNDGETAWQVVQRECDFPVTELELEDMKRNVTYVTQPMNKRQVSRMIRGSLLPVPFPQRYQGARAGLDWAIWCQCMGMVHPSLGTILAPIAVRHMKKRSTPPRQILTVRMNGDLQCMPMM